jgi:hypothetical protein
MASTLERRNAGGARPTLHVLTELGPASTVDAELDLARAAFAIGN